MKTCIASYSQWTTGKDGNWMIFDHPDPLTVKGTVGRMLESFIKSKVKSHVVIFPNSTHHSIENHVKKLVKPYMKDLDVHVFTGKEGKGIVKTLKKAGFPKEFDDVWGYANYGQYRNWMLLYAAFKGYDNILTIDDDELIEQPGYVEKVCERDIGEKHKGVKVWGKGGCYTDARGNKFYDGQIAEFANWPKDRLFNQSIKDQINAPGGRLTRLETACGGNMIENRKMFLKVPYDINIPRGEDDDYAMNAEYLGFTYFYDKDMVVRHLPPLRTKFFWTRMRQDIKRFKYLREKVRIYGVNLKTINVFYKYFLQDDLEYKAVSGSIDAARRYMDKDRKEVEEFLNNAIVAAKPDRKEMIKLVEKQIRFMEAWGKVLPKIEGMWE
jgi:glycosyltransferase involved in cell wall biosynthesis